MKREKQLLIFLLCIQIFVAGNGLAAEKEGPGGKAAAKPQGPPPALVEVAQVVKGEAEPMVEFVGTVYYARKSNVAAEVEGVVEQVSFEEGYRVKNGDLLVSLGADILETVISATRADRELVLVELAQAKKELSRRELLYGEGSVSESAYDEYFFQSRMLENRALSLQASIDKLLLEKQKKDIRAPFDGIVVQRNAERGEWVKDGGTVAVVADDSVVDIVVNVPAGILKYLTAGKKLTVKSGGDSFTGDFRSFVPKGDVATRTFDVKIRMPNSAGLVEGMEARALVPAGARQVGLKVPRDAVIDRFGQNVVWLASDGAAKMVPVHVTGYDGMQVGVAAAGLADGNLVVVKGNERLREGQPLRIGNQQQY